MLKRGVEVLSEILGSDGVGTTSHSADLFSSNLPAVAKAHDTFRLESADGLSLPSVIVPASGDAEDFFASVATYYQEQSPISAVVHVLSSDTASLMVRLSQAPSIHNVGHKRSFRMPGLGAAIGEATLAGLEAHDASGSLTYAACRRTLAFALCRTAFLYESAFRADALAERWARLRRLTGLSVSATAAEAVVLAHTLVSEGSGTSNLPHIAPTLSEALRALARSDDGDCELLVPVLVDLYPATKQYLSDLHGAFDGRMAAFTRLVETIQANTRGVRTDEIAVAFICDRILPGSFAHAGVLAKLVNFFPNALVWYGFLAAFSKPSASGQLSPSLIAKLERDLLDAFSFEQRPRCDISIEELEVLSRAPLRAKTINPSQPRVLRVALLPGVDTYTRFRTEDDTVGGRVQRDTEAEELHRRVARLLEEALSALRNTRSVNRDSTTTSVSRRPRRDR